MTRLFAILAIIAGPWITNMHEDGFSVLWTTDEESIAWVQLEDGQRVYEEFAGRWAFGRLHQIRLRGLDAGRTVSYSIGSSPVIDHNSRRPKFGKEEVLGPFTTRTFSGAPDRCRFSIMNDMHMNLPQYSALAAQIDPSDCDFIQLNGDIISAGNHPLDSLVKYEISPLGELAAHLPVMYCRGNHESRGDGIRLVSAIYPAEDELPFSYIFRQGPAAFLVLDSGETGVKNAMDQCGKPFYEDYLREQMEWVRKAVQSPEWKSAQQRFCFVHAPMIDFGIPGDFVVHGWMNRNFVPILNEAGVNIMIAADYHEYIFTPAGRMGNDFPIIVNDSRSRADVKVEGDNIAVDIYDVNGNITHSLRF